MNDHPAHSADVLKSHMETLLALLDHYDYPLPAAWLAMAIEAMPTRDIQ
jgi:hypothetical protein